MEMWTGGDFEMQFNLPVPVRSPLLISTVHSSSTTSGSQTIALPPTPPHRAPQLSFGSSNDFTGHTLRSPNGNALEGYWFFATLSSGGKVTKQHLVIFIHQSNHENYIIKVTQFMWKDWSLVSGNSALRW